MSLFMYIKRKNNTMKNKILFLSVFCLLFCYKSMVKAQEPSKMTIGEFNQLDSTGRSKFLEVFAKKLSTDTIFIKMQQESRNMQNLMMQQRKGKVDTAAQHDGSIGKSTDKQTLAQDNLIKSRKMMVIYTSELVSNYPSYGKMDRESMRTLLRTARLLMKKKY